MKRELDLSLCARFPKIFAQRQMPMIRTAMSWGFECGDGWFNLIDSLCESIQAHVDHSKCWQVKAIQVDEKYGGLRFYYSGGDDTVFALVSLAENLSERTCEVCGAPGAPNETG